MLTFILNSFFVNYNVRWSFHQLNTLFAIMFFYMSAVIEIAFRIENNVSGNMLTTYLLPI